MTDRAQACYGGSISQVNESWGVAVSQRDCWR